MNRAEKVAEIMRLRSLGLPHAQIARHLDVSRSTVNNLICDPDGSKQRKRRQRYQGTCETCGAATDGSNGRTKAPRFCAAHAADAHRTWTRETVIVAIQRWALTHGRPPVSTEWNQGQQGPDYPVPATIQNLFGSWANGIEAAGFPRPLVGHYDRNQRRLRVAA